jgi:hypothetical protein
VKKEVVDAELGELGERGALVVLARDRVQNAAPVEALEHAPDTGHQRDVVALEQNTPPERVVQVPDHALDRPALRLGAHGGATS